MNDLMQKRKDFAKRLFDKEVENLTMEQEQLIAQYILAWATLLIARDHV